MKCIFCERDADSPDLPLNDWINYSCSDHGKYRVTGSLRVKLANGETISSGSRDVLLDQISKWNALHSNHAVNSAPMINSNFGIQF